jgi:cytochrome c oxidase assembly protein subunit 15
VARSEAFRPWRFGFACLHVVCTYFLLIAGGTVTSMDAGLAVPDWPTSYGQLWFIPMPGNVFYEHGHRIVAQCVGLLTIVMAVWIWRTESRGWLRTFSLAMVAGVIVQGILGGLTVLYLLPPAVSVAHGCTAQLFFCGSIFWAYSQSREWRCTVRCDRGHWLVGWCKLLAGAVFLQLVLGATVRHTGSALAIPDFPRALGQWIPPFEDPKVIAHFAHRLGALLVSATVVTVFVQALRRAHREGRITWIAALLVLLVAGQVALGAWTVLSSTAPQVATLHVVVGAAILGLTVFLGLRCSRREVTP